MQSNRAFPTGQNWLIEAMDRLGFKKDAAYAGACFGIAHMAMQAILGNELPVFEDRLWQILAILQHNAHVSEEMLLSIQAFFNGIELYRNPAFYSELFSDSDMLFQSAALSIPLTLSLALEKEGGICETAAFYGTYSKAALINYFTSLRAALDQPDACDIPSALILNSGMHAITVHFDHEQKTWSLFDVEQAPVKHGLSDTEIANTVHAALTTSETAIFSTSIFSKNALANACSNIFAKWVSTHVGNSIDVDATDSNNTTILRLAIMRDDVHTVEKLLKQGANPNESDGNNGKPLIYFATYKNNLEIVRLLLKYNAHVDAACRDNGYTALACAARDGHQKIAELLFENDANPEIELFDNETPMSIACANMNLDIFLMLQNPRSNTPKPALQALGLFATPALPATTADANTATMTSNK